MQERGCDSPADPPLWRGTDLSKTTEQW